MHTLRKRRLIWIMVMLVLVGLAAALALYALRQNIDLFFVPKQIVAGEAPKNHPIRVGGWVEKGSVHHSNNSLQVSFVITDHASNLSVIYNGILPDLFREGQAVVVEGQLNPQNVLVATQVLAKHDENYTPPQIK
ncbi:MAG: cytochrome biosis protein CcmE [Gammaproteobacteria bacterium]|jgi:cytochrome c-type biogenesis protein CcmE|nr:cytochrome biosis protein CcmE [Gammaproteobacteria bacterium]